MKAKPCTYCGGTDHFSIACFNKPRRPIKKISDKYYQMKIDTRLAWFAANPPDELGYWDCYLHITDLCYLKVNRSTINLEHVYSKARRPDLRTDITNIRAACPQCNKLKGSRSIEDLYEQFPHLKEKK